MGDRGTLTTSQVNEVDPTHLAVLLPFQNLQRLKSFFSSSVPLSYTFPPLPPSSSPLLIFPLPPPHLSPPPFSSSPLVPSFPPLLVTLLSLPLFPSLIPSPLSSPLLTHRGLCKHDGEYRVRAATPVVHASGCCCTETIAKIDPALREAGEYCVVQYLT